MWQRTGDGSSVWEPGIRGDANDQLVFPFGLGEPRIRRWMLKSSVVREPAWQQ